MKRRPRDIGTAAESAVVRAIRPRGFPSAERRALRGTQDAGDITGTPGVCWSVKGGAAARSASDGQVSLWLRDLDEQIDNAGANVGVLVIQRAGVGEANAWRWWAIMRGHHFAVLCAPRYENPHSFPVRMLLGDACDLLRMGGYGSALDVKVSPPGSASARSALPSAAELRVVR